MLCTRYMYFNIIYCCLRNEVSNLNHHLYQSHLSESSECDCGCNIEDNAHFFLRCPLYKRQRAYLLDKLSKFNPHLDVDTLLGNNSNLSPDDNIEIAQAVLEFIKDTKRFH